MDGAPQQPRRGRWTLAGVLLGAGVTSLLAAIGFGVFARTYATRAQLPVRNSGGWDSATPGFAAVMAVLVSVLLLTAVVIAVVNRGWLPLAGLAGILAPWMLALCALPRHYRIMVDAYPPAQSVPVTLLAWTFAMSGAIVVLLAACCALVRRSGIGWRSATVGVAAAVAACVAFSVVVMGDMNPDRLFTATTAPSLAPPPVPDAVTGPALFTLRAADYEATVRAAEPGFVVRTPDGVRAFDADGRQRCEHLGKGPWQAAHIGVFDDGKTVVIDFDSGAHESGQLVGLDADTGERLWRHGYGPSLWEFRQQAATWDGADLRHLMLDSGRTLDRIDTRTGEQLWSVDSLELRSRVLFQNAAGIGYFGVDDEGQRRYIVLDPATGERRSDVEVDGSRDPRGVGSVGLIVGGEDGLRYVNAQTGGVWPFDTRALIPSGFDDQDFLTWSDTVMRGRRVTLRDGADGRARCDIVAPRDVSSAAWLPDAVLLGDADGVSVYRRADCAALPSSGIDGPVEEIVKAPGVLLMLEGSGDVTTVTGYR